ncbi:MAG: hypothetical protein KAT62_03660 [Desulfuromonadales bacterium]|nr:hypothetical protein [Desulfuromonadales bacterium]
MSAQGVDNRFLTDDVIIKDALVLLKNSLVAAPLVYRDLEKRFGKVGDTISLKKPFRTKTASGRTLVKQPLVDQTVPFEIDRQEHFGLEVTMRDRTLSMEQFRERYLKSGITQIANVIDRSIILKMKNAFFSSGTPGTALTTKAFHLAKAYQGKVGVPDDGMRRGIMDMIEAAEISDAISNKYNEAMVKDALQKGYMGPLAGYDLFESANVPTHTVGTYAGTPLTNGAGQTGATLVTDGWSSGAVTLNEGDVFTIAGVYEINPQNYQSTGRLQRFVVQAQVSDTTGDMSISISPSINDGSLTTVDGEGNTVSLAAFQNVSAAPADGAAITVMGTSATTYTQNFLFHRDAVALAMVDLELPQTAVVKSRVRDPDSGLSLCMTGAYDIQNQTETTRIDAVWGTDLIYPELAHRVWGDNT